MTAQSPLFKKLARMIETGGPISLADYMHICLSDIGHGYYRSREAIGAGSTEINTGGDFITAPEISQMFGELVGIWLITAWQSLDRPKPFSLIELGPGKGTLMRDILRTAQQLPDFLSAADVVMVETSNRMITKQREVLEPCNTSVNSLSWQSSIADLPDQPALFLGNEFLDALPFRQYVKAQTGWHEVLVSLDDNGNLQFGKTATRLDDQLLPETAGSEPDGSVFEHAPARQAVIEDLADFIASKGGAALLIDYGHDHPGFGDTFQAVRNHTYTNPLELPGECDLTSHVDFAALCRATEKFDALKTGITTQGEFLLSLGLLERAGALGAGKSSEIQESLRLQVERLAAPDQMGRLFKVMAIMPKGILLPAFGNA